MAPRFSCVQTSPHETQRLKQIQEIMIYYEEKKHGHTDTTTCF